MKNIYRRNRFLAAAAAAGLITALALTGCGSTDSTKNSADANAQNSSGTESTADANDAQNADSSVTDGTEASEEDEGLSFPYQLEDGKLTVNSLFTSDLPNPDCNNEEAESIASIEVTNQSDECLTQGTFTVTTMDGTVVPFTVTCLPAGQTAWLFAQDNTTLANTENPVDRIEDDVTFTGENLLMSDTFEISAEESTITLTNISGADQTNITVYCHDTMDDTIYGGITYTYTVDYLSAGETTTIDAIDCMLGTAEVVYVTAEE